MLDILIDTNIYRKDPNQTGLPFKAIKRLCKASALRLHIPYIVLREFQTQQLEQYRKEIQAALKGISTVLDRRLSDKVKAQLAGIKTAVEEIMPTVEQDAQDGLVRWAEDAGATLYPMDADDARRAMEAYFTGQLPLKESKSRKDIPDAFLFQSALTVLGAVEALYIVSEDGVFGEAAATVKGITVLKSLSEFIELPTVQAALAVQDVLDKVALVIDQLATAPDQIALAFMDEIGEKVMWEKIQSKNIPDDNHEASISSFGDPKNLEIDFEEAAYFGEGQLGLPFRCSMTVSAIYYFFKSDFYMLDVKDQPSISDHNDHYFEAEDDFEIVINGSISVNVNLDLVSAEKGVDEYVDFDAIKIDEVTNIDIVES